MSLYELEVSETRNHKIRVEAHSINDAISRALASQGEVIDTQFLKPKPGVPKKLGPADEQESA